MIKIDHIGIAVRKIEESMKAYESLGLVNVGIEMLENEEVKIAIFDGGGAKIELIEPLYPDTTISNFLAKRGEGLHHIAFKVDSIERAMKALAEMGIKPIGEVRKGGGGSKIVFFPPRSFTGVLVELVEK